jgi:hypothetical protein
MVIRAPPLLALLLALVLALALVVVVTAARVVAHSAPLQVQWRRLSFPDNASQGVAGHLHPWQLLLVLVVVAGVLQLRWLLAIACLCACVSYDQASPLAWVQRHPWQLLLVAAPMTSTSTLLTT